jgi:hypothetical protein
MKNLHLHTVPIALLVIASFISVTALTVSNNNSKSSVADVGHDLTFKAVNIRSEHNGLAAISINSRQAKTNAASTQLTGIASESSEMQTTLNVQQANTEFDSVSN